MVGEKFSIVVLMQLLPAQTGVGFLGNPSIAECVVDWVLLGGRGFLKLKLLEQSLCVMQVFAPDV